MSATRWVLALVAGPMVTTAEEYDLMALDRRIVAGEKIEVMTPSEATTAMYVYGRHVVAIRPAKGER